MALAFSAPRPFQTWITDPGPDTQVIERWYRERGLLRGNMFLQWERMAIKIVNPDASATKIQSLWRGFLDRRYVEDLLAVRAAGMRVYWNPDGEMIVTDLNQSAARIQRAVRGWLTRISLNREEYLRKKLLNGKLTHGLTRGGKKNPVGSFKVSKKKNTILAEGFIFQKGGDQRWAVGMKSEDYCPCHVKIDQGTHYLCMCQCTQTVLARTSSPVYPEVTIKMVTEKLSKMIFT